MGVFWHRIHIRSFLPSRRRPRRRAALALDWHHLAGARGQAPLCPACASLHAMVNTVAQPQGREREWPVENLRVGL